MKRNLKRVAVFVAESNGAFTEAMLRWWIFNAAANGLTEAGAIVRIGRAIWIDVDRFDEWIDSQQGGA